MVQTNGGRQNLKYEGFKEKGVEKEKGGDKEEHEMTTEIKKNMKKRDKETNDKLKKEEIDR